MNLSLSYSLSCLFLNEHLSPGYKDFFKMWFSKLFTIGHNIPYCIKRKQESLFTYFDIVSWTHFWWRAFEAACCHTWNNKWDGV